MSFTYGGGNIGVVIESSAANVHNTSVYLIPVWMLVCVLAAIVIPIWLVRRKRDSN